VNPSPQEIDVLDAETENLSLTQPAAGCDDRQCVVALRVRRDDRLNPLARPGHDLVLLDHERLDGARAA